MRPLDLAFGLWLWRAEHAPEVLCRVMEGNRAAVYAALAAIFGSLPGIRHHGAFDRHGVFPRSANEDGSRLPHYNTMWNVFTKNIQGLSIGTVGALVALVVDRDKSPHPWVMPIVVWSTTLAVMRIGRTIWLLEKLVEVVKNHKTPAV